MSSNNMKKKVKKTVKKGDRSDTSSCIRDWRLTIWSLLSSVNPNIFCHTSNKYFSDSPPPLLLTKRLRESCSVITATTVLLDTGQLWNRKYLIEIMAKTILQICSEGRSSLLHQVLWECVRQQLWRVRQDHRYRLQGSELQGEALARGLLPLQQVQNQSRGQTVRIQGERRIWLLKQISLHKLARLIASTADPATMHSSRLGVMDVVMCSRPGWRRWSTRQDSGTRSASSAAPARIPSAPRVLSPRSTTSTAPSATRRSLPPSASSAARWVMRMIVSDSSSSWSLSRSSPRAESPTEMILGTGNASPALIVRSLWLVRSSDTEKLKHCKNCSLSSGQRFTSRDDKPYCADCFGELFSKRCTACSKPITGDIQKLYFNNEDEIILGSLHDRSSLTIVNLFLHSSNFIA